VHDCRRGDALIGIEKSELTHCSRIRFAQVGVRSYFSRSPEVFAPPIDFIPVSCMALLSHDWISLPW
jgi:hypothetical protein